MSNPEKVPEIELRRAGDEVLVHDLAGGKVHVLNGTAGYVLELCDGTRSATEIARTLSNATGADYSTVANDVDVILREFESLKLLAS